MEIVLIILGSIGWIADVNQWFIVPPILYKSFIIMGVIWEILFMLFSLVTRKKFYNRLK